MSMQHLTTAGIAPSKASRRLKRSALMLSAAAAAIALSNPARAQVAPTTLPSGGSVVAGSATIGTPTPTSMTVDQSTDRAVINWNRFDIGSGASVAFNQPSATSITVNRVTSGAAPSEIAGSLTANGIVAVLNPNGVFFSGTANVDVGGMIASTGNIDDTAFMAGGNLLGITGADNGEIVVQAGANISVANAGLAAFVAPTVRNNGTITATAGRVQLGAGTAFTLDLAGDGLLQIDVGANSPLVENFGGIFASGGRIQLSARQAGAAIEQTIRTGVLPVGSARLDGNAIVLDAAGQDVDIASEITGTGNLTVAGNRIAGAADVNFDGNLTLDVNSQGAIADTTTGSANWISDALGVIGSQVDATTINLGAGIYAANTTISRSNVTLAGAESATIAVGLNGTGLTVNASDVTVSGLAIRGPVVGDQGAIDWQPTTFSSTGIVVGRNAARVSIAGNALTDLRTGIRFYAQGNAGSAVTGNLIENTKGAVILQYADAAEAGISITGNREGQFGNEWGIVLNTNTAGSPLAQDATAQAQANIMGLSNGNNGMTVMDRRYATANRSHVVVDDDSTATAADDGNYGNGLGSARQALKTVQAGVYAVAAGGTVDVRPGDYVEGVTGVGQLGGAGSYQFGLFIPKSDITLRGIDASGNVITSADNVAAFITSANQSAFGAQHFVSGSNVTIEGLGFKPAASGDNKMLEVIGNNFTLRNSVLDVRGNKTSANFYLSDFELAGTPRVESFHLEGNIFYGATLPYDGVSGAGAIVTIAGGVGRSTDASNRVFANNRVVGGGLTGQRGFQIQGRIPTTAWQQLLSGAVTVTGNSFDNVDVPIRTFGALTQALAWDDIFRNNGNSFLDGAVLAYEGSSLNARATLNPAGDADIRITSRIGDSVAIALDGDTVRMLDGTYDLGTSQLKIDKSIALIGESEDGVIIDGRAVSANGLGTISVLADNVSLGSFTLYGSEAALGNYGIKVQPNSAGHVNTPGGDDQRVSNFAISDVTVRGSRRAELDLNGVVGATITNFTADGRRVADGTSTEGAGVQITDSADVTLTGVHTLGNNWGGVALYQSNGASGYDGQTTNITIDASLNTFEEANGLFSQRESTTQDFGTLNLAGFDYAVRNTGHRDDGNQFVYFRTSLADATAYALALGAPSTSSIEGYAGDHFSNVFSVADGLSINAATRDVRAGGTINVGAGTYAETVAITRGITLNGAGMDATSITGGIWLNGTMRDVALRNFTVSGTVNASNRIISNQNVTTNLIVDGVRIDGGNSTSNGFVGGQIAGAISITNSQFVNIRGFQAFDTGSSTGNNAITSAVFANNLLDNTVGSIAFRPDPAMHATIDITGNVVTHVGSTSDNVGAVFKVFGGSTVNFTGNDVSGVGITNAATAGGPAFGAVLVVRNAAVLNVTDNVFTDNNQVFAVESGMSLPTTTNFTGNIFTNNGYSIYLPTNLVGAGTISFGAGNDFVAGADTVQHIAWRSSAGLDLTNVLFDGVLASDLSLDGRFAVADLISDGIDRNGAGLARLVDGEIYVTTGSGVDSALRAVALSAAGDTINLSAGTHTLTNTLFLQKNGVSVLGQGIGATTIDASGHNSYGIRVHGNDVTLGGFTLDGSSAAVGNANYGIKVEAIGDANARNTGFVIRDVAIDGSRKTGLDINSAVGALIDGVSVTGVTNGNGIAITDSADVTVRNSSTAGNAWGGLALYQSNNIAGGGRNQQLTGITIAGSNSFTEATGLYLQDSSATLNPGTLTLEGYGYAVRNFAHSGDGSQFVYFQRGLGDATAYALALGTPASSSIEGYAGDHYSNIFTVVDGLGIAAAARDVRADGTINVGAGTYASGTTIAANGVTLNGAAGARIDATHNGDNGVTISADGVTVQGFEIFGAADRPFNLYDWPSITRGVVVSNGADNATVANNTIHDVRNGILIDGRNANAALTGNLIDNTKSAISVQYTDGSNIAISGNREGANGNEWGIIAYLNGIWNGATVAASGGALGPDTPLSEQLRLLDLSAANGGMAVYNQGYSAQNRTRAYVNASGIGGAQGSLLTPTNLQGGLDAVVTGGTVHIASGIYNEDAVLNGLRVLDMGAITVGSLTFGAGAAGTNVGTSITATGALSFADGLVLTGDTLLAGNSVSVGAISSPYALTLAGNRLAIGPAALAGLTATGDTIVTAGVTTTGAQSYTGATTLAGGYTTGGAGFTIDGNTTLAGNTSVATNGGPATLGALAGAHGFTVDAASGNVTLGMANGLASLTATGSTITTAGASTTGAQRYAGATTLSSAYTSGGSFTVDGGTTLAGDTDIAGSAIAFGTVDGAGSLALDAGTGNVTLGAVDGLSGLSAIGGSISTAGVATTGNQSYAGATRLSGTYTTDRGSFAIDGATTLGTATIVSTGGGDVTLGTVAGGGNSFVVNAGTGATTLGAANGLSSLTVSGASITTAGAATTGAQSYTGAATLDGAYTTAGGDFLVNGTTTLSGATAIATGGGDIGFGAVGGVNSLAVNAGTGNVTLGAANGLTSLTATGTAIITAGASTTGVQNYTGATTLSGTYTSGSDFTVNGATTLDGATTVATGGNAGFGTIGGANSLGVDAGTGNITLGAVNGLTSLSATGASIATAGASTTGAQSYTGATALSGTYATGGDFTVNGATTLSGATTVNSGNGDISLGAVDAAIAGSPALALDAGTGTATLGAFGTSSRLGAVSVNAGQTVLNGATYSVSSLSFTGGANATVRLTQGTTTFDTTLPSGADGAIAIQPNLIGTVNGQQNVVFVAGNGLTPDSGDVAIGNVGSDAIRLGTLTVNAHDFSAATVKLASNFTSLLSGSQVFTSNTLDTLGDVVAQVAGTESGPIRAGGAVSIDAGGSGTGSIIAGGPVSLGYAGDVSRAITSTGPVSVSSGGAIGGSITSGAGVDLSTTSGTISSAVDAAGPVLANTTSGAITGTIVSNDAVTLGTTSGAITGAVNAAGPVSANTTTGDIAAAITSGGGVALASSSGAVGGSIQASGPVNVDAGGSVSTSVTTSGSASLTSSGGGVSSTVNAGGPVAVAAPGPVTSSITSGGSIDLTSSSPINVQVNGGSVTVNAPGGTVGGVFNEIHTDDRGTFVINDEPVIGSGSVDARQIIIDRFVVPAGGIVSTNGEIQLPAGLALGLIAPAGNDRRPPVVVNSVQRLGELLRIGYTAIIIQLDERNLDLEEELNDPAR
ncbi:filamentous hemagglutinin N-terminal domain-containing protein [Sphingomonas sp. dw_22]|uniref:filamentous hemagglutinin N-terminal domain-containing protein n=1 Tax=Sphingomonas sp. dw_22 TaxID=2721175 RepID=UPI001BD67E84|nr:filamentous hemagglutinin N-terminal domain-containing protein [Sphingomonas sp. dw_22]